jgi:SWI/SNF-related matrix-associated actin-dependent regulator 1 of chromatin subfamily A
VIKLITKDSIDEDMLNIGMTKLQLDDAVGGEKSQDDTTDENTSKEVRKSLLTTLRNKFVAGGEGMEATPEVKDVKEEGVEIKKEIKKARGSVAVKEE